jgi:hypothetical protein
MNTPGELSKMIRLRIEDMRYAVGCRVEWIQIMSEAAAKIDQLEARLHKIANMCFNIGEK